MKNTIGILAGMGPKSTAPFLDKLISAYQKKTSAVYDIDYPPIFIYSLPTPFFPDKNIDHKNMEETILEGLKRLENANVSFIAMPCITAHIYYEKLSKQLSIPLLNMIDVTVNRVSSSKKITVLGTRPTLESQIFKNRLENMGFSYEFDPLWQDTVDKILIRLKSNTTEKEIDGLWKDLLLEISSKDIETIIFACTDLKINPEFLRNFTVIDSSVCLVDEVISCFLKY